MTDFLPAHFEQIDDRVRLAAIVESSDDAIISKTLEGIITSWNKGAERIFGYTADEIIGRPMTTVFPPDRQEEEQQILSRLCRGERVDHFETVRMAKDGRLINISATISPVRDKTGRIVGASKIARDITMQKEVERRLREALDATEIARSDADEARHAAEAANRAKDHFLSILSHELRTPLTPVLAALSFIECTSDLPAEEIREHIGMIRRNVETQSRLVDDLLDVTRISKGKLQLHMEVVDTHAAIRNVLAMLQSDIDAKRLSITSSLHAKDRDVWADPGRFQQILLNLVSNAVKFTPTDGTITIRTENEAAGGLKIDLVDSGIGIAPDILPRLFEAFEQGEKHVTRKFGGLGLGLSIVRSLVDLHGGTITATSAGTGKGATFSLRMATIAANSAKQPGVVAPPAAASTAGASRRVLLVEDHDDTRLMLVKLLRTFGCQVTAASNVREAVDLADQNGFDLLVSDIGLPDGTGLDVMRYMRARQPIRGIALSGFGQEDDLTRSHEAGFEQHLIKPVNFQVLRSVVMQTQH